MPGYSIPTCVRCSEQLTNNTNFHQTVRGQEGTAAAASVAAVAVAAAAAASSAANDSDAVAAQLANGSAVAAVLQLQQQQQQLQQQQQQQQLQSSSSSENLQSQDDSEDVSVLLSLSLVLSLFYALSVYSVGERNNKQTSPRSLTLTFTHTPIHPHRQNCAQMHTDLLHLLALHLSCLLLLL